MNPAYIHVATLRRTRRALLSYLRVVHTPGIGAGTVYDGIPCQRVPDAIRSAVHVIPERLADAANRAREQGCLTRAERDATLGDLGMRS